MLDKSLEIFGSVTGLLGAALLSLNNEYSGFGFVLFLFSNFAWMGFGYIKGYTWLVIMQVGFTLTSLAGIYNWLIT